MIFRTNASAFVLCGVLEALRFFGIAGGGLRTVNFEDHSDGCAPRISGIIRTAASEIPGRWKDQNMI
jgi:hypothetical protein